MAEVPSQRLAPIPLTWPSLLVNPHYVGYQQATMNNTEGHSDNENGSGHDSGYSGSPGSNQSQEPNGADGNGPPDPMPQIQMSDLYYRLASILECQIYLHNQTREELLRETSRRESLERFVQQQDWDLNNWAKTCHTLYENLNTSMNQMYDYAVWVAEAKVENERLRKKVNSLSQCHATTVSLGDIEKKTDIKDESNENGGDNERWHLAYAEDVLDADLP